MYKYFTKLSMTLFVIFQRVLRNEPPPNAPPSSSHGGGGTVHSADQRDRSLTVLIPRAKYRPASQPSSTLLTMSTFGPEQKLLNYAASRESSRTPEKKVRTEGVFRSNLLQRNVFN